MKNPSVVVVDHDPAWAREFSREAERIRSIVTGEVHHIGSTAVPGLAAKPIIDMLLEVDEIHLLDDGDALSSPGYVGLGEYGILGRRYFVKGEPRSHQIHAFQRGNEHIARHLSFRDYLRAYEDVSRLYAELKQRLAATCRHNIDVYMDGKDEFVKTHEAIALDWARSTS